LDQQGRFEAINIQNAISIVVLAFEALNKRFTELLKANIEFLE